MVSRDVALGVTPNTLVLSHPRLHLRLSNAGFWEELGGLSCSVHECLGSMTLSLVCGEDGDRDSLRVGPL